MNWIERFIESAFVSRTAWTLLHFLWQGTVVAGLFTLLPGVLRLRSARSRYLAGCVALILMAACPVATFVLIDADASETNRAVVATGERGESRPASTATASNSERSILPENEGLSASVDPVIVQGWAVLIWLVGVGVLSTRLIAGSISVSRLKRHGCGPAEANWIERLARLKERLGICRPVLLLRSALVEVPTVVGWLRPAILLPASCVTGLTPQQLESILAHELAHIRRHDYLVNILQNVVETVLFYQPAVWLVSARVRAERENCCDDVAVEICRDRVLYGHALARLEEVRCESREFALAASDGSLKARIRRLFGIDDHARRWSVPRSGGVLVLTAVAITFGVVVRPNAADPEEPGASKKSAIYEEQLALADDFYERAMSHFVANEYEQELEDLNKALELNPNHVEALFSRATLRSDLPKGRRAEIDVIDDYTRILRIDPMYASARYNRGLAFQNKSRFHEAIVDYTAVIEERVDFSRLGDKDGTVANAHRYRGNCYQFGLGEFVYAIQDYNRAIELDPSVAKPEAGGRIILRRAQAYHALRQYGEAEEDFRRYTEIGPEYFDLWQSWAWQLATCPDPQYRNGVKALEYARKGRSAEVLAAAYAETGRFDEAVEEQKKASSSLPDDADEERTLAETRLEQYKQKRPWRE